MSCNFIKRLLVLAAEVIDFHLGNCLRLFSKARWVLPSGEEERMAVDGKSGLNVCDGCVSEVETVVDGL
jgi:hypothetical protein